MNILFWIKDIIFGTFSSLFVLIEECYVKVSESGLDPDWLSLTAKSVILVIIFGSAFMSASVAEMRNRNRLIHCVLGLIIPWIYPVAIFFLLPKYNPSKKRIAEEHEIAEEKEVPESHLKSYKKTGKDEISAEPDIMELSPHYFAMLAKDEAGTPRGPFILKLKDGRILEISKIINPLPDIVIVEIEELKGNVKTVRFPYSQIQSCQDKSDNKKSSSSLSGKPAETSHPIQSSAEEDGRKGKTVQIDKSTVSYLGSFPALSPGQTIKQCRIVRKLGQGGMGAVYLAHHAVLDIPVALKVLSSRFDKSDSEFAERFLREAKLAARIKHDNVVSVMDAGKDDENELYYIVLEYVERGTMTEIIRENGPLDEEDALKVIYAVTKALEVASDFGIVHRDIKPDNIMLSQNGTIKLADLGLAKGIQKRTEKNITIMEKIMGSPPYMSPEQAKDFRSVDIRADIYSLGASLYHMLTGDPPFVGDTHINTLMKVLNEPVPDPRQKRPDISDVLAEICMKMMAKDPKDRFQSPEELLHALNDIFTDDKNEPEK